MAAEATSSARSAERRAGRFLTSKQSLQALAERFAETRCPRAQEEIIRRSGVWAGRLARGVARRAGLDREVTDAVAALGLCKALDRYRPDRGEFEPFARAVVAGEIRHFLRGAAWPAHVPRQLQEHYLLVAMMRDELRERLGHEPDVDLVARAADLDAAQVRAVSRLPRRSVSLDGEKAPQLPSTGAGPDRVTDHIDLARAVGQLTPAELDLLKLRFYEGFSQREVAEVLGTNQVKVSRLLTAVLLMLRRLMEIQDPQPGDAQQRGGGVR